jgi:Ni/Co efflux regulator RcnB
MVCCIEQPASSGLRNPDGCLMKKQCAQVPAHFRTHNVPPKAELNSAGVPMKTIRAAFALLLLAMALASMPALAQDHQDQDHHDNHTYRQHQEWKAGSRVQQEDWNRGDKVDYRQNHLRRPPEGHEWRQIDGNYVMARQDGTIVSVRRAPRN